MSINYRNGSCGFGGLSWLCWLLWPAQQTSFRNGMFLRRTRFGRSGERTLRRYFVVHSFTGRLHAHNVHAFWTNTIFFSVQAQSIFRLKPLHITSYKMGLQLYVSIHDPRTSVHRIPAACQTKVSEPGMRWVIWSKFEITNYNTCQHGFVNNNSK